MKKLVYYLAVSAVLASACSCVKADDEFVHDDVTISAISMATTKKDVAGKELAVSVQGAINQDDGTITFSVPLSKRNDIDLTAVKIRANVGFDAYVTVTKEAGKKVDRTLYGIHDISEGIDLTVTARMTGNTKDYHLKADYYNDLI